MNQVRIHQSNGWAPARFAAPPSIGQPMPTPLVPPPKKSFIDSAAMGGIVSGAGAVASGLIGHTYTKAGSKWGSLFWVISGVMGFITLDNFSRLRGR